MIIDLDIDIYKKLSEAEKKVIEFINNNEESIPNISITKIAKKTFTSSPTVSRTIQKCGFSGINDLRYQISEQKKSKENYDNAPYVVNNILAKSFNECTKTIESINSSSVFEIIEYIKTAKRIYIYSRGFTALIAEEFQMYLQLLGYDAVIVKDVMWMKKTERIVTNDDMIIILSVRNSTVELLESAIKARAIGAKVITCICKDNTELEKYSDVTIVGHTEQIMDVSGLKVYSRVPLLIITRTIIEYIGL